MFAALFRALIERVRALFMTDAALDLEAQLASRQAERQAELLRQADRYEEEGLHGIARQVRRQAEVLNLERPLQGVLPAVEHLQEVQPGCPKRPALADHSNGNDNPAARSSPGWPAPNAREGSRDRDHPTAGRAGPGRLPQGAGRWQECVAGRRLPGRR